MVKKKDYYVIMNGKTRRYIKMIKVGGNKDSAHLPLLVTSYGRVVENIDRKRSMKRGRKTKSENEKYIEND